MRQYTTPEQTAKLIELGFEKPKSIGGYEPTYVVEYEGVEVPNVIIGENKQCPIFAYSIGELIEMLPEFSCIYDLTNLHTMKRCWYAGHVSTLNVSADELVDALYDMIVKLKKEGVI